MKKLFVILLLFFQGQAFACSCAVDPPFIEAVAGSKVIALVKVTRFLTFKNIYEKSTPMSMEVEIISLLQGEEKRKTVIIWGDPGNLCRPYLSVFTPGEKYVIALREGQPGRGHKNEKATDYCISICGENWLPFNEKTQSTTGRIINPYEVATMSFEELREKLVKREM